MDHALIERHMPMARGMAWQAAIVYRQSYDDAYSDALMGLVRAAKSCRYPDKFRAYARAFIRGNILRGIRDRSGKRSFYERGEEPPVFVPLNPLLADREDPTLEAEKAELWRCVDSLGTQDALITRLYYQWELSQSEIADLFGYNQMRISRILAKARSRLAEFYDIVLVVPEEEEDEIYSSLGTLPVEQKMKLDEYIDAFFSAGNTTL